MSPDHIARRDNPGQSSERERERDCNQTNAKRNLEMVKVFVNADTRSGIKEVRTYDRNVLI